MKRFSSLLLSILALLTVSLGLDQNSAASLRPEGNSPSGYCPEERYSDVCHEDWFFPYVMDLADLGAITGYPDGTFRPHANITRGQIERRLIGADE